MNFPMLETCYLDFGWAFCRLSAHDAGGPSPGKRPLDVDWPNLRPTLEELMEHEGNIGVITGSASGIVILDVDPGADLTGLDVPPTVTAITGRGGNHYYYSIPEGVTIRNRTGIRPHVDIRGEGGQAVFPGSRHPNGNLYEWLNAPGDVPLAPAPAWMYDPSAQSDLPTGPTPRTPSTPAADLDYDRRPIKPSQVPSKVRGYCNWIRKQHEGTREVTVHAMAIRCGRLIAAGLVTEPDIRSRLTDAGLYTGLDLREVEHAIDTGLAIGLRYPRPVDTDAPGAPDQSRSGRPVVLIPGSHTDDQGGYQEIGNHEFTDAVINHLPEDLIYRRDDYPGRIVGTQGRKRWQDMPNAAARLLVDSHVELRQWITRKDPTAGSKTAKSAESTNGTAASPQVCVYRPCTPDHAALILAAAGTHPRVRDLTWITHYPVYGPDWQLARPGWNDNGIYYDEPDDLKGIEPVEGYDGFVQWFQDLLTDFPFADRASLHNYMALLLTPIVAPALHGNRPLFLITAPVPRTGKSKLAEEVAGGILLGTQTPALQLGHHEDEREKRITSLLLSGDTLVHLDNLAGELNSPTLASLLTAATFHGRVLGASKMVKLTNTLTVVATGNNVKCSTEMAKRIVPIRLTPTTARPELRRDFKHPDLAEHIRTNRRMLFAYLLGAVETYRRSVTGPVPPFPRREPPAFGGFESWAKVVGGILIRNGFSQMLGNRETFLGSADAEGTELERLVKVWAETYQDQFVTTGDLLILFRQYELYGGKVLGQPSEASQKTAVGKIVGQYVDAPVGGWKIQQRRNSNRAQYCLVRLAEEEESGLHGGHRDRTEVDTARELM